MTAPLALRRFRRLAGLVSVCLLVAASPSLDAGLAFSQSVLPPSWVTQIGLGAADPEVRGVSWPMGSPFVKIDASDNTIVAATVRAGGDSNILVLKYSSPGKLLWQAEYSGPGASEDSVVALALGPDGGPVMAGTSQGNTSQDVVTVAYSPAGAQRWARVLDSDGASEQALDVAVHRDGSVAVIGSSYGPSGDNHWVVASYRSNGELRWVRCFGVLPTFPDSKAAVAIDGQGNVVVAGSDATAGDQQDVVVVTYAPDGSMRSQIRLDNGQADTLAAMRLTPAGEPVVVTKPSGADYRHRPCGLAKLAREGPAQWSVSHEVMNGDSCNAGAMTIDSQGSIIVVGRRTCVLCDNVTSDPIAFKYSGSGQLLWDAPPGGVPLFGLTVTTDSTDSILIGGYQNTGLGSVAVVKLSSQGVERWRNPSGWCGDLAVGAGDSLAAVSTADGPANADLRVLALASDGTTLWSRREGPTCSGELLGGRHALAVNVSGGSLVVGTTFQTGNQDWLVTRLDASGDTVWSQRYDSPEHGGDLPVAAALDDLGNALVAGYTWVRPLGENYRQWGQLKAYGPAGAPTWSVPNLPMNPVSVIRATGGAFWVAGTGSDRPGFRVQKWSGVGTLDCEWTAASGQLPQAEMVDAIPDSEGGLVMTGTSWSSGVLTARLNAQCQPTWAATVPSSGSEDVVSRPNSSAVAVGPEGVVAVVGSRWDGDASAPLVQWFNPSTSQEWVRVEDCPGLGEPGCLAGGGFQAVAFDTDGNVLATGWTTRVGTGKDITTVSYAPNGWRRWVRHYSLSHAGDDAAISVVVDAQGIALVNGSVATGDGGKDFVTLAYGPDGTQHWVAGWSDPTVGGNDVAMAAALDPLGGLIVAGNSHVGPDPQITILRHPIYSTGRFRRHLAR